ncbi:helix-turn-helix domain-containing protein [Wukongibacter baidiensis]|uniref:AraC family transcriptional regulator n=1 Tax=Wukongibacter baidiensis TaxID=1723361 RepID=UPI003D7F1CE9
MACDKIDFTKEPVKVLLRSVDRHYYHWHNAVTIIQVLSGAINLKLWTGEHILTEKHVAVINTNEVHHIYGITENKVLIIYIDCEYCQRVIEDFRSIEFYCCTNYNENRMPEKYDKVREYVFQLLSEMMGKESANRSNRVKTICNKMLTYLVNNFDYLSYGCGVNKLDDKFIKRYKRIYEYSFGEKIKKVGLKEVAAHINISPYHLSREISKKFGYTYQQLQYAFMVACATRELLGTDKSIISICNEIGFSDAKYIIKYFKHYYGCTPSEFRNIYKNNYSNNVKYEEHDISEVFKYFKL